MPLSIAYRKVGIGIGICWPQGASWGVFAGTKLPSNCFHCVFDQSKTGANTCEASKMLSIAIFSLPSTPSISRICHIRCHKRYYIQYTNQLLSNSVHSTPLHSRNPIEILTSYLERYKVVFNPRFRGARALWNRLFRISLAIHIFIFFLTVLTCPPTTLPH